MSNRYHISYPIITFVYLNEVKKGSYLFPTSTLYSEEITASFPTGETIKLISYLDFP
jgi:hypothetical protein